MKFNVPAVIVPVFIAGALLYLVFCIYLHSDGMSICGRRGSQKELEVDEQVQIRPPMAMAEQGLYRSLLCDIPETSVAELLAGPGNYPDEKR